MPNDVSRITDIGQHMAIRMLIAHAWEDNAMRSSDPANFIADRQYAMLGSVERLATNSGRSVGDSELLKHVVLHELETFFESVSKAVATRVEARRLQGG